MVVPCGTGRPCHTSITCPCPAFNLKSLGPLSALSVSHSLSLTVLPLSLSFSLLGGVCPKAKTLNFFPISTLQALLSCGHASQTLLPHFYSFNLPPQNPQFLPQFAFSLYLVLNLSSFTTSRPPTMSLAHPPAVRPVTIPFSDIQVFPLCFSSKLFVVFICLFVCLIGCSLFDCLLFFSHSLHSYLHS